jgi:hypothetical protein
MSKGRAWWRRTNIRSGCTRMTTTTSHTTTAARGAERTWEHRTNWHTREHNHNILSHGHDYDAVGEERHHGKEAHIHDHPAPTESRA